MRSCIRCGTQMIEDCGLYQEGDWRRVMLEKGKSGLFQISRNIGPVMASVCPSCGEISIYIEDVNELKEG